MAQSHFLRLQASARGSGQKCGNRRASGAYSDVVRWCAADRREVTAMEDRAEDRWLTRRELAERYGVPVKTPAEWAIERDRAALRQDRAACALPFERCHRLGARAVSLREAQHRLTIRSDTRSPRALIVDSVRRLSGGRRDRPYGSGSGQSVVREYLDAGVGLARCGFARPMASLAGPSA